MENNIDLIWMIMRFCTDLRGGEGGERRINYSQNWFGKFDQLGVKYLNKI